MHSAAFGLRLSLRFYTGSQKQKAIQNWKGVAIFIDFN